MKTDETNLVERIQNYMPESSQVVAARWLDSFTPSIPNVCEADAAIHPFAYRLEGTDYELRGAFTNGDTIWEEDDKAAFQFAIGEEREFHFESSDGEILVIVNKGSDPYRVYETYTRGTSMPLYAGDDEQEARASLELSEEEWENLLDGDGVAVDHEGRAI